MPIQEECIQAIIDAYENQDNTKFDNYDFVFNKVKNYYGGKTKKTKERDS